MLKSTFIVRFDSAKLEYYFAFVPTNLRLLVKLTYFVNYIVSNCANAVSLHISYNSTLITCITKSNYYESRFY